MRPLSERDSDLHVHPGHPTDNPDPDGVDATESGPWHDAPAHLRTDESAPDSDVHVPGQRDPDHDEPAAATHDETPHDETPHDETAHEDAAHAHHEDTHDEDTHDDDTHDQDTHDEDDAAEPEAYVVTPEPAVPPAAVPVEPVVVPVATEPDTTEPDTTEPDTTGPDGDLKPGDVPVTPVGAFLNDEVARDLRERWRDAQLGFVDDPRQAADDVRALVNEAVDAFMAALSSQRDELNATAGQDTEQFRVAVQRYRGFFDRLLNL